MVTAKMKRRLKRRGKTPISDDDHTQNTPSSPPRLHRNHNHNNSTTPREFAFNLEQARDPVINTFHSDDGGGGGTISTVTNDVAFRNGAFLRCGFDAEEYHVMTTQLGSGDEALQLTVSDENLAEKNKSSKKKVAESPMGVNEFDSSTQLFEWADFDKAKPSQPPGSATRLNLRRNAKKDDDTFFYSESAPSEADTTNNSKLVGEEITLGSSGSYLHSFDILEQDRRLAVGNGNFGGGGVVDARQLGMERVSPDGRSSYTLQRKEVEDVARDVQTAAVVHSPPPPTPPPTPQARPTQRTNNNPKEDIAISKTTHDSNKPPGCTVPDIVHEIVDDVRSILTHVISVAYLACSESEQCLSRCQGSTDDELPSSSKPQPSPLDTIEEDIAIPPVPQVKRLNKSWAGDYLCRRVGTEETADNSSQDQANSEDAVKVVEGMKVNRWKKFLSLVKSRR